MCLAATSATSWLKVVPGHAWVTFFQVQHKMNASSICNRLSLQFITIRSVHLFATLVKSGFSSADIRTPQKPRTAFLVKKTSAWPTQLHRQQQRCSSAPRKNSYFSQLLCSSLLPHLSEIFVDGADAVWDVSIERNGTFFPVALNDNVSGWQYCISSRSFSAFARNVAWVTAGIFLPPTAGT